MADIVTSRIFTDGERGITAQKLNDIVGSSVIQPAFYTNKPTAGTADPADIALILKSGAYAQVPISALAGSATQAQIWSARLRSFNAIGNPTFEVDQRNAGNQVVTGFICDRWLMGKVGTLAYIGQKIIPVAGNQPQAPGTTFNLSNSIGRIVITTSQASLGSGDQLFYNQVIEGSCFRELASDVHSLSLLVKSSVANLKFSIALRDLPGTQSLVKLCTIPVANVWTLIQLPNLPVWPSGNFSSLAGNAGYQFTITLAAGTSLIAPAADTWQSGNFIGAPGMSNFAAQAVNSSFDIGFVQHEPVSQCSTFIDKPFVQNYDECLRYYQKSYDYDVAVGTANAVGSVALMQTNTTLISGPLRFHKPMAKIPTCTAYSAVAGTINTIRLAGVDYAVTSFNSLGKAGLSGVFTNTMPAVIAGNTASLHYTADTGW